MITQIYEYLRPRQAEMLATLRALVEQETPTENKAAIDSAQAWVKTQFAAIGGASEMISQTTAGDHQRITLGDGEGQLLLLCHIDTVYPMGTLATMPFKDEGRIARGPGIFDMKGGIIIGLYAIKTLQALGLKPKRKLVMLVTSDEETGSHTSRALIEAEARQSSSVIVLEPGVGSGGAIKTWRKGIGGFDLTVKGRAAHAGADPELGRSAILEAAHQIIQIHALNDYAKGTTLNAGVVNGGTRSNVVAAEATVDIDVRVMTQAEWDRLEKTVMAFKPITPDTQVTYTGQLNRPPMERTPEIVKRFQLAQRLAAEIDYHLEETGTGGGSDGNFTAALGIPTFDGAGAIGEGAHSPREHIIVDMLPKRAALIAAMLMEL